MGQRTRCGRRGLHRQLSGCVGYRLCQSPRGTVRGLPYQAIVVNGRRSMLSFVSGLSGQFDRTARGCLEIDSARVVATRPVIAWWPARRTTSMPAAAALGVASSRRRRATWGLATASEARSRGVRLLRVRPLRVRPPRHRLAADGERAVGRWPSYSSGPRFGGRWRPAVLRDEAWSVGHVAIYAGNGRIIHASAGSRRIRYDDLSSPRGRWFIEHLSSVRRVVETQVAVNEAGQIEEGR